MEKSYKSTRNSSSSRTEPVEVRVYQEMSKGSSSSFFKSFMLTLAIFVAGIGSVWGQTVQTITASGSWTVPAGVTSVTVYTWGGGGGAGGSLSGAWFANGGGGGGGAMSSSVITVTAGQVYTMTIGAGGAGGAATGAAGATGGTTTFTGTGGTVSAVGGAGGAGSTGVSGATIAGGAGGLATSCTGTTKFNGGTGCSGANGTSSTTGRVGIGGGGAGSGAAGTSPAALCTGVGTGGTGTYPGGLGGKTTGCGTSTNAAGVAGAVFGGGGGGANCWTGSYVGGAGGAGRIVLVYTVTCTAPTTQAAIGSFTNNNQGNAITVNWVNGNGNATVVVARLTATTAVDPGNGASYTANTVFGSGSITGTGNFVVYNGTGTSVNVTGLTLGSSYTFTVYTVATASNCYKTPGSSSAITTLGYCVPTSSSITTYFSNFVTSGGSTNISNATTAAAGGYINYSATLSASQYATGVLGFSATIVGGTAGIAIFVDWNNDMDFADAGEPVYTSNAYMSTGTTTSSFTIPAGTANGNYRMRIVTNYNSTNPIACSSAITGETEDYTITVVAAPACAQLPSALVSSNITTTTATISWTAASPAPGSGYDIYYSTSATAPTAGTAATTTTAAGILTKSLTGLTANTTYYFWVRSNCNGTNKSNWAGSSSFYTGYCQPSATSVDGTGITNVAFGVGPAVNNATSTETNNYGNYSAQIGALQQGVSSTVAITYTTSIFDYNTVVWVDWNNDLDFADAGETVYTGLSTTTAPNTLNATFTVPLTQPLGNYRMRIGGGDAAAPGACSTGLTYTCWEDYTIQVIAAPVCPQIPTALASASVTNNTATISWTAASPAPASGYQYYVSTSSTAPTAGTTPTGSTAAGVVSASLTGLTANTAYYFWVRSNCTGTDYSNWTASATFTTDCDIISTFPWTESFSPASTTLGCWRVRDGNADGDKWVTSTTAPYDAAGSHLSLYTDFNTTNQDYAISPRLNLGTTPKVMRFYVRDYSTAEPDELTVKISTTNTQIASFTTTLLTLSTTQITTSYVEYEVDLTGYTGNVYLAFVRENAPADGWYIYVDQVTVENKCIPSGDEVTYGNGSWNGYVYKSNAAGQFSTYKGIVTESETFNRTHTSPTGATTNVCSWGSNQDLFTIRYKMTKNFPAGDYIFTIGGDDGVRLSVDGGTTWLINQWVDQGYVTVSNSVPVTLNGSTNLVFEYYDNTGGAQSSFSYALAPVPTCATYTSPANGATGQVVNPSLTWGAVANATSYDVYIGVGSLPSTPTATVTGTTYTASCSGLTNYVWKVVPKNANGAATGCSSWTFTTMNIDYATAWISANTGNAWWCEGETRTVTVTVKNNGAVNWIDGGGVDYNVGIKWNNDVDYPGSLRVDANLAAGATGTYSFTVTAPSAGNNNLTFDVVREACFWFGTNASNCGLTAGPGNSAYSVTANVNSTYPSVNAGTDLSACVGVATNLNGSSSVSLSPTLLNETFSGTFWTTNDAARWASVATATAGGTTPEARFTYSSGSNGTIVDANIRSSLINASNYTGLTLSFRHMLDWYTGTIPLSAEVSTNGTTWTTVWSQSAAGDITATNVTGVNLSAMNGQSFYVRFRFNGNIWNIDNWYIDNVVITGTGSTNVTPSWSGPNSFSASTLAPTITSVIPGANNYTISSTYLGCSSSDVVQITGTGPTTIATTPTAGSTVWRGATSTDWTTASNWYAFDGTNYTVASATPTAFSDVIIPANQGCVTQQPTVISGTVDANNVTVETGAALTMTTGTLNVAGNFTVNGTGTFTPGTGTVNFTGGNGVTQLVTVGSQAFNNVTLNGSGTVQLSGNTSINGYLTINDGQLLGGNNQITVKGDWSSPSTGFNAGTSTVVLAGASGTTQTINNGQAGEFFNLTHNTLSKVQLAEEISLLNDFSNSTGEFSLLNANLSSYNVTISGNWTNSGTFTPGTATVFFSKDVANENQNVNNGNSSFYDIFKIGQSPLNSVVESKMDGDLYLQEPVQINGTISLTGTNPQSISGGSSVSVVNIQNLKINKAGTVTLSKPVRVDGTLTMTQGNIITTATNKLEIGSSTSALGSVNWTSGNVVGPMRRWFAGSPNSTAASGLFPVGLSTVNRYAQINFTAAPGQGGYIDLEYKAGAPANAANWTYLTTPDGQLIQTFEDEGYWDITPYDASGNAYPSGLNTSAFTMKLRANGLTSVNDITITRIIRSPGPLHTTWEPAGFHLATTGTSSDFAIESNTITGFSWFNIGSPNNNALPVELLNFNGTCNEGMVNLVWQTASEFNSSHFDVEKSTDGETWRVLATIPSAGTSNELLTYQTVDNNGTNGSNYYRLRQVDIDGKEKLYDPINVSCAETTAGYFTSYPNPSGNEFQVVVNNKEILGACTLNIVDAQGKVIDKRKIEVKDGINMFVISEKLTPGIYFLNITNGTKTTQVIKHAVK